MQDLAGRTALLTGASGGLGSYIARALAGEGMDLVLAARSRARLETVAAQVRAVGVKAIAVPTDLTDPAALEALVDRAQDEFGAIDVLVNNAAIERICVYDKLRAVEIERVVRVNLTAPMLLTRLVLPGMLERGSGHIVNVSSVAGKAGLPYDEAYTATKAGLIALTESLRVEYKGTGVSASVICPGFVEAGLYLRGRRLGAPRAPRLLGTSPPEAVAEAVVRAIRTDTPEIIVGRRYLRLLSTLAELSPQLGEWIVRRSGAADWFWEIAWRRAGRGITSGDDRQYRP